ncbi:MAG: (2Fe-2S)-binding protein [Kofleriaceae bacterium]|nr:(2Fe-2S)-binding protein [Myxococcales bacterium]MCB9560031.1 (2Fe-2S)-binding protein [Kofleriaceae bacterium]MCB9571918.1 (2Fe-2S)-binding protein [Kofleriaceae bacterium]
MSDVQPPQPPATVTLTVDGKSVTVPKGTNVLEAAKQVGVDISAFCYHPGLSIAACCRQCLVSIEKAPKLAPSCQTTAGDGMVVHTTDPQSTAARKQMLEFTLVNHPIDCPICDKAGECTLQKLYFENDNANSRVDVPKVHKPKVVDLGPHVVLDAERCILCTRCIRVCDEVAGEHQLEMSHRGAHEELGTAPGARLDNPYSINTVDVCPVGALTAKDFRFTMRAWELEATPSVCNGCATGCNTEIHHRNGRAWRLVPRHNPDVNQYWMCDEGRFTYHELREDRLAVPTSGGLPASWDRALAAAAQQLQAALKTPAQVGVVLSAQASNEENFALAKLAAAWKVPNVFVASRAPVPDRADDILRDADVDPNRHGVAAIAPGALGMAELEAAINTGAIRALVVLGHDLPLSETGQGRLREIDALVVLAWREIGPARAATIALPIAAWAERSGTITNRQGRVQRQHAALPPPGQAVAGWEALVRLAGATGAKLSWTHVRDVHKDMVAAVKAFEGSTWARDVRPIQLRFANSRG